MNAQERLSGSDGVMLKVRTIATQCSEITADMPRTLLLGVTAPDPETTPNCRHADPRGFWVNRLDTKIAAKAVAEMLGVPINRGLQLVREDADPRAREAIAHLRN